ncbi:MAG TPA: amidohydrolase family protein [Chitinophagaceae bacterium]
MKIRVLHIIFRVVILIIVSYSYSEAQKNSTFVFAHANVVPMNKEIVLPDYTVIVKDGTIREMGSSSSIKIPKNATVINAKGKFLVPALSDMHVHLEGDAWNIMYPPGSKFTTEEINFNDILFLYIANGITTIDVLFAFPEHILLREKIRNHEMLGPRLILSRMIDGAGKAWPPPLGVWINNADEAKKAIIEIHQQGYDRIKVYSFLDKESYDTIIATAKKLNMPVDGHVPYSTSVEYVLSSGQRMIAHIEEIMKFAKDYNPEQINYYADLIAKSNTWVTSSLILNRNLNALLKDSAREFSKPGTAYLHPMGLGIWKYVYQHLYKPLPEKNRLKLIEGYNLFQKPFAYAFYKKGGNLLTGTDALVPSTLPGFSLHEELEELVSAGLTPFEALKISTTNTYEFLGELNSAGTIEAGKIANFILLDKNPLENISNTRKIAGVMKQDRWISKIEIDKRLKEIADSYTNLRNKKFR